jgi:hypothetical protein
MTAAELEAAHTQRPYLPITLHLDTGEALPVPVSTNMARRPGDPRCYVLRVDKPGYEIVELARVVRITTG